MAKTSVRKDDYVMVIAGKDKGKTAQILAINAEKGRALIDGAGLATVNTKAVKARKATDKGGLVKQPGSIDISNVMPICSACNKPTRVGYRMEDGKRVRYCKKCGATLVTKKASAKATTKAKATTRKKAKPATDAAE
ncbi:MAG: 50S ribosomal protein L24 [Clostridia bacterium]|nr:50S ribosomal protein L24 [Clostridia bacterium]